MSLRETLNNNPAITTIATLTIIAIAVGFIIYSQWPTGSAKPPTSIWFSNDDGQTWYKEDIKTRPPTIKDGKEAVLVHVYQCGNENPFIAFMERYTPEIKKQLEEIDAGNGPDPQHIGQIFQLVELGRQFKKPGDKEWITMNDQRFGNIMNIQCPDKQTTPTYLRP